MIRIVIPGEAVPKARPRFTRAGIAYTPAKTRSYEQRVAYEAVKAMDHRDPLEGPVEVEIIFWRAIPASWSRTKRAMAAAGEILPATKPDLDNLVKAVTDAMNGIVWKDDAQVVHVSARKRYGKEPLTVVHVGKFSTRSE